MKKTKKEVTCHACELSNGVCKVYAAITDANMKLNDVIKESGNLQFWHTVFPMAAQLCKYFTPGMYVD